MEPQKNDESLVAHLLKNLKQNEFEYSRTNFLTKINSKTHSRGNSI